MRKLLIVVATGGLAWLSACGSDGNDRLTLEQFLAQGNEICVTGDAATQAATDELLATQPDAAAFAVFYADVLAPSIEGQLDDLAALAAPADIEDEVDKLLADARAALDSFSELVASDPEAAFSGDDPFADIDAQADAIGLTSCGGA
ncbi:MAG: hypothetical protein HY826_13195 [Actinobacteria bacterium]|nr:hypothetical protein [Actinomycetota bacterium]